MTIRNFPLFHMPCPFPHCSMDLWRLPCSSTTGLANIRRRETQGSSSFKSQLVLATVLKGGSPAKSPSQRTYWSGQRVGAPGQKPVDPVNLSCSWGRAWAAGCRSLCQQSQADGSLEISALQLITSAAPLFKLSQPSMSLCHCRTGNTDRHLIFIYWCAHVSSWQSIVIAALKSFTSGDQKGVWTTSHVDASA